MPTNKDFKRLVRARMEKTGEAYTAARTNLLRHMTPSITKAVAPTPVSPPVAAPVNFAKLAGMSDEAIKKRTGCAWDKWVWALDKAGAADWSHRARAEYVQQAYKVSDWWAQTVTVGYERIKGLREIGQRMSGAFEATKSKTIAASAAAVQKAFADSRQRRKWLPGIDVVVRKAVPGKSVRMTWDDGTSVEVWLTPKGAGKTATAVAHRKLKNKDDVERRKAFWAERLDTLSRTLS